MPDPTTSQSNGSLLVIDDEPGIRESLELLLEHEGYQITTAATGEAGLRALAKKPFDAVLLDVSLPDKSGLEVLREIRTSDPSLAVVMITAYGSVENAVAAMQGGASNYITKPWDNEKLLAEIRSLIRQQHLTEENRELKRTLKQRYNFSQIIGKSDPMLKIFDLVAQVAPSRATILIQGESGTGKELIAKAIHANSPRAGNVFVPVNTGSMPVDLLDSTLFGHVRGAFTSAVTSKRGLFEVADHGTIFFDEIGTVGPETQTKLLRVIQEREFMYLGGTETVKVDVRILAATNVDLHRLVQEGKFREDLYYRLNVISIHLPPLRDRKLDIPLLVEHFAKKYCEENAKPPLRFSPEAMQLLLDYDWPGNVRELENTVERAVILSSGEEAGPELLPEALLRDGKKYWKFLPAEGDQKSLFTILDECERRIITDMLEQTRGNQTEAAERFQVPLSTLNQKIKRLNIEIKKKRDAVHH
ncbi:MAG: sigma-54-dependent Fis family transcriptional regulator [Acidobacteria bacterium]|nr:sigma-54-dependent Fis family transcriptional regulator [Acidobacteriota bacterium]